MSFRQRLGALGSVFSGKSAAFTDTYQKVGLKVAVGQSHMMRVELMSKALPFINDKMADIADRVDYLDELITLVGQPWGRGRSDGVWAEAYTLWQEFMGYWKWFESQRRMYQGRMVVVVQQLKQIPVLVALEGGGTRAELKGEWGEDKMVSPETYLSTITRERDSGKKDSEFSMKLVRVIEEQATIGDSFGVHPQFNQRKAEQVVRNFGEREMITSGMIVLNFAWHEMDVTVQSVDVIVQPAMQQGDHQFRIDPTSQIATPDRGGSQGVKKT